MRCAVLCAVPVEGGLAVVVGRVLRDVARQLRHLLFFFKFIEIMAFG